MGNEFGHPEWIDFPREGNGWSYKYARRQWSLEDNPMLRYGRLSAFDAAMVHYLRSARVLEGVPEPLMVDEEKKILIFKRKNSIFALNFNKDQSFSDYSFAPPAGEYRVALSSDEVAYDGFDRVRKGETHLTVNDRLFIYLPSRCAIVLDKIN